MKLPRSTLFSVNPLPLIGMLTLGLHGSDLSQFTRIISSYYAKEMCSCLYVIGQPESFCHDYVRQYIPIQSYELDAEHRTVTVKGLWRTNRAHFVDDRYGCVLEE